MRKAKLNITILMTLVMIISFAGVAFAKGNVRIIDGNKAIKGKDAPRFIIETIDGEDFKLHEYRDKKAIIITFWGINCLPCMKELTYLQKFYDKHSECVEVIAITADPKRFRTLIKNKVKELDLKFKIGHDYENKLRNKIYLSRVVPFLVVINQEGKVILLQNGLKVPDNLVEEMEKLLGDDLICEEDEPEDDDDDDDEEENDDDDEDDD